jgi:iron complex transport system substrate-binding protein
VYPLTISNCGRELTFDKAPERVVLLNGTSVGEVSSFVVLGLQDRIVANSQRYGVSDDPSMVAAIDAVATGGLSLNENFEVPREQVLALEPDLVVSTWAGGFDETIGSITRDQLAGLGINSYVTPSNCSFGAVDPRPEDEAALAAQTYESSFDLLRDLGAIFDVQAKAAEVIADIEARVEAARQAVDGEPASVLIAFPGMSMMNENGLPAVFAGPLYDSIIAAAGGVNAFVGRDFTSMASLNAEGLASADVDVLVIGLFLPDEDAALLAEDLFAQYPQWEASKTKTYTSVSDSIYLGPFNAIAVEKISAAIASRG